MRKINLFKFISLLLLVPSLFAFVRYIVVSDFDVFTSEEEIPYSTEERINRIKQYGL